MSKDYYKILGVDKKASQSEIKTAYMKLVKKHHPDINKASGSEEKFKEINEAYDVLKDSTKRRQYDSYGSDYQDNYQGNQNYNSGYGQGGFGGQGFSGFDFEDIFKQFGFDNMFGSRSSRQRESRAANLEYLLEINLEDAFSGTSKKIEIPTQTVCSNCGGVGYIGTPKTCPKCHGTGKLKKIMRSPFGSLVTVVACDQCEGTGKIYEKKCSVCRGTGLVKGKKNLNVKIPRGVTSGTVLRLKNEGFSDAHSKGDLYLKIVVKKHSLFSVEGADLFSRIHLDLATALLGGDVKVRTIDGDAKLKIPKGLQSYTVLKMKGLGMPKLHSSKRGDHYVKVIVDIPKDLTKDQTQALKIIFGKDKKENKDFLKKLKSIFK